MTKQLWLNTETGETKEGNIGEVIKGLDWTKVPDDADICIKLPLCGYKVFYKDNFKFSYVDDEWGITVHKKENLEYWNKCAVIWKREEKEVNNVEVSNILERNDENDSTHTADGLKYINVDGVWYVFEYYGKWVESSNDNHWLEENLTPITKPCEEDVTQTKDQRVVCFEKWLNGEKVEIMYDGKPQGLLNQTYTLYIFKDPTLTFRIKPKLVEIDGLSLTKEQAIKHIESNY